MTPKRGNATGSNRDPWRRALAVAIAAGATAVHAVRLHPWMLDDAFISFRYAEFWASGAGPVFNAGERVEGYTSFLWVALLAIAHAAGCDTVVASLVLGALFALGTLVLVAHADRFVPGVTPGVAAAATILLGTCGSFSVWARSGMEVPLFTFLVTAVVFVATAPARGSGRREIGLGVACAGAALARPEGLVVAGLVLGERIWRAVRARRPAVAALAFLAVYAPYVAWRWAYYGFPLPNTFYAKVGSGTDQILRGLPYVAGFALAVAPLLVVATLALVAPSGREFYRRAWRLPTVVGAYVLAVLAVGGDCMPAHRFFAHTTPLVCVLAATGVAFIPALTRRRQVTLAVLAACNVALWRLDPALDARIADDQIAYWGRQVGVWMREHLPADAVVAVNTAGTIPYYSRLRVIDMLGLNDVHIGHRQFDLGKGIPGHEKADGAYVLARRPAYIQFGSPLGARHAQFLSDRELWRHPAFHHSYTDTTFTLPSGRAFVLWVRRR